MGNLPKPYKPTQVKMLEVKPPTKPNKPEPIADEFSKPTEPVKPLSPVDPVNIQPTPRGTDGESNALHSMLATFLNRARGS